MDTPNKKESLPKLNDPNRPKYLAAEVDSKYDHIIGAADARITIVKYGSYASSASASAHEVVVSLHTRFGDQMRYVFRHLPVPENKIAKQAAVGLYIKDCRQAGILQLEASVGAGAISGIGFTMSIFIASLAIKDADFPAAKIAIFIASFAAAGLGALILWPQHKDTGTTKTSI